MRKSTNRRKSKEVNLSQPALILTPSEARAEAVYLVLKVVLTRIAASELKRIQGAAYLGAHDLRIDAITEEVECLFPDWGP